MTPLPDPHDRQALLDRFHQANERFHATRVEWEQWLDASEFRHEERVDAARAKLRDAERELEEVEEQIRQTMALPASAGGAADRRAN
jgi:hypothetical protein